MEQTIAEHMMELKKQFVWIIIPIVSIFIVAFAMSPLIIKSLIEYIALEANVVTLTPFEGINTSIMISGVITLVLSIPFILYSLYRFSKPALSKNVDTLIVKNILTIMLLAVFGMCFGIFIFSKMVLNTLLNYNIANPMWSINSIIKFVMVSGLAMALVMQTIIVIPTLNKMGMINIMKMKESRWIIVIFILILSAMVTPPDVVSQVFMFIPFYGSIELGMLLSKRKEEIKKC
jgi:sec-independent protein translocase protein TatC